MKTKVINNNFIFKIKKKLFPFYKSRDIAKVFNILEKDNLIKNRKVAMFVGGCVRKFILNEEIDDIDVATIFTPDKIKEKFKNTEIKIVETGLDHGTVTIFVNKTKIELTTLRKDISTDGRHAEVSFIDDWTADSLRRDFTINAIYLDRRGKFFDPQKGQEDLKDNIVRFIGDPSKRIEEDYLRIIRFIRFSLLYNNEKIDNSTLESIKLNLNGIKFLSKERILDELIKILKLKNFHNIAFNNQLKIIFTIIFPELKYMDRLEKIINLKNNSFFKNNYEFILASLLIGDGNNHEYFCHKYKTSNKLKEKLHKLANSYYDYKSNKNYLKKELNKNIYLNGKNFLKELVFFIYLNDKKMKLNDLNKILKNIEQASLPNFPYDGAYLIKKGLSEGKNIGLALKKLEQNWIENNYKLSEEKAHFIIKNIKD